MPIFSTYIKDYYNGAKYLYLFYVLLVLTDKNIFIWMPSSFRKRFRRNVIHYIFSTWHICTHHPSVLRRENEGTLRVR